MSLQRLGASRKDFLQSWRTLSPPMSSGSDCAPPCNLVLSFPGGPAFGRTPNSSGCWELSGDTWVCVRVRGANGQAVHRSPPPPPWPPWAEVPRPQPSQVPTPSALLRHSPSAAVDPDLRPRTSPAADVAAAAAGVTSPCRAWKAGSEYLVRKAYNGKEQTDTSDGVEAGYLACDIGDRVSLLDGIPQAGHVGNREQSYFYVMKKTETVTEDSRAAHAATGWIPCSILGERCFGVADESSMPTKSRSRLEPPRGGCEWSIWV